MLPIKLNYGTESGAEHCAEFASITEARDAVTALRQRETPGENVNDWTIWDYVTIRSTLGGSRVTRVLDAVES